MYIQVQLEEKDLGITLSDNLKMPEQCGIVALKANRIRGLIRRNVVYKEEKIIISLYKSISKPLRDYYIQTTKDKAIC